MMNEKSKKEIKIALVIQDTIFRKGLASFISKHEGMYVALDVSDMLEFDDFIVTNKDVDICITDLHLHKETTAAFIEKYKHLLPSLKFILFSNTNHPYNIKKAIAIGCNGIIDKYADAATIIKAVLSVHYAGSFFEKNTNLEAFETSRNDLITDLELRVLKSLCSNKSNQQISKELSMSTSIITAYKNLLFSKLNVNSREMLIKCAYSIGLIES